jgi:hypothetical protein
VINMPPTTASANACQVTPRSTYLRAVSIAVSVRSGSVRTNNAINNQPATRLVASVVAHNRINAMNVPDFRDDGDDGDEEVLGEQFAAGHGQCDETR